MKNASFIFGQFIFISIMFFSCRKNESDSIGVSSAKINGLDIASLEVATGIPLNKDSLMLFEFFLTDKNFGVKLFEFYISDIPKKIGISSIVNINDQDIPAAYLISLSDDIILDYYNVLKSEVNEFKIVQFNRLTHEVFGTYGLTFVIDTLLPKVGTMEDTIRIRNGNFIAHY